MHIGRGANRLARILRLTRGSVLITFRAPSNGWKKGDQLVLIPASQFLTPERWRKSSATCLEGK
jgi:hypothetical protein